MEDTVLDIATMLETIPDFIAIKRFDYSLAKLEERYPDGAPDRVIAAALQISEDEVGARYARIVSQLRTDLGTDKE